MSISSIFIYQICQMLHTLNLLQHFKEHWIKHWWELAKKNVWYFLLLFLISIAASALAGSFSPWKDANGVEIVNFMSFFSDALWVLVSSILAVASINIYLDLIHGKLFSFSHFKLTTKAKWWIIGKWVWWYILYSLIVIWGLVLLIVPGIYFAIRLSMWQYYLIDKKMTIKESLRASRDATKWHEWQLIGIGFLSLWICILWFLALGIWLLWAIPTTKLAFTDVYKKISAE